MKHKMAEEIYVCNRCFHTYKKKGWLLRHLKEKQHGMLFSTFVNKKIVNTAKNQMFEDISEIKMMLKSGTKTSNVMNFKPKRIELQATIQINPNDFAKVISEMHSNELYIKQKEICDNLK